MSQHAAVLFANDAFYVAFAGRDYEAMEDIWSQHDQVTCIHPGWRALIGYEAVMQSWRAILTNPDAPNIICRSSCARVLGSVAYVICYETIDGSTLIATNVFVQEDRTWKLVHHQAGPSLPPLTDETEDRVEKMQ